MSEFDGSFTVLVRPVALLSTRLYIERTNIAGRSLDELVLPWNKSWETQCALAEVVRLSRHKLVQVRLRSEDLRILQIGSVSLPD